MISQNYNFVNVNSYKVHYKRTVKTMFVEMNNHKTLINLKPKTIAFSMKQYNNSNLKANKSISTELKGGLLTFNNTSKALKSKNISQKLFISFQNTTKLPIYTSYSKMDEVKLVTIGLASANRIRQWAEKTLPNGKVVGEVTNANTLHHKTFKPQKGGLFCERIFGPLKDFECACGGGKKAKQLVLPRASQALPFMNKKEKDTKLQAASAADQLIQQQEKIGLNHETNTILGHTTSFGQMNNYKRFFCSKCDVEYTWSVIRRYQLGYIKLNAPVTHVWYVKGNPSYISLLLDMKKKHLEYVTYCAETLTLENSLKASATADDFTIGSELPKDLYALWEKASTLTTSVEKDIQKANDILDSKNLTKEQLKNISASVQKKNWYYFNSVMTNQPFNNVEIKELTNFNSYGKKLLTNKVNHNLIIKTKRNKSFLQLLAYLTQHSDDLSNSESNGKLSKLKALYNERTLISQKLALKNDTILTNLSVDDSTKARFEEKAFTNKILAVQTNLQTDPNVINANALVAKYEKFFANSKNNKQPNKLLLNNKKESKFLNSTGSSHSLGVSLLKNKQFLSKAFCASKKLTPNNSFTFSPLNDSELKSSISNLKEPAGSFPSKALYAFNKIYIRSSLMQKKYNFLDLNSSMNSRKNFENTAFAGVENYLKLNYLVSNKELDLRFNSLFMKMLGLMNSSNSVNKNDSKYLAYLISLLNKRNNMLNSFNKIESYMNKKIYNVKILLLKSMKLSIKNTYIQENKDVSLNQNKQNKKDNMQRIVNSLNLLKLINFSKISCETAYIQNLNSLSSAGQNQLHFLSFVPLTPNNNLSIKKTKYSISLATVIKLVHLIYLQNSSTQFNSKIESTNCNLSHKLKYHASLNNINMATSPSAGLKELISKTLTSRLTKNDSLKTLKSIQKKVVNVLILNRMFVFLKKYNVLKSGNISLFRSHFDFKTTTTIHSFSNKNMNFLALTNQKALIIAGSALSLLLTNSEQSNSKKVQKFFDKTDLPRINKTIVLNEIKNVSVAKKQTAFENLFTNKYKLTKLAYNLSQSSSKNLTSELSYSSANKFIVNNIYCLSHRELWDQEKDWYFFAFYFFTAPELDDISVPVYEYRNYDFSLLNTFFSKEPATTTTTFSNTFSNEKSNNIALSNPSLTDAQVQQNPVVLEEKPNLHISYSGAGMIQALLAEFDYFELKKMDKQNRILLYDLNKYLKKLKKSLSLYSMAAGKMRLGNSKSMSQTKEFKDSKTDTSLFNKNYSLIKKEFKEVCKQRDSLIRRTKFIRKVFRNYTGFSRSTSVDLYSGSNTAVQNTTDLNSHNSTSLDVGMNRLTSMVLTLLPVLPPDLRPIVKMGSQIAASDLNRLYQRVIYRNDRLKKFLKDPTTNGSFEMKYAQRLLQEAVDNLIQNGKSGVVPEKDARGRALKSLSDLLKGKQGRFRQYLLGKRVDYSGRSVIVVGPKLKLHECGIPKEMALELYLPFLIKRILTQNLARTVIGAKALIQNNKPLAWALLREIMKTCPVLLNRAPTLHRLGFQAFQPKLVDGRAILLHPLVCPAFNADFDGDQMAVHVPITVEARTEAWKLMLARNNLLSPATGEPLVLPSQDMVLGCYYLTNNGNLRTQKFEKGYGMYFDSFNEVLRAYYQGVVSTHAMVWVKWEGYFENPNADHLEQPIEIRINKYGVSYMIYPKHHSIYNKQNQLVKRMIRTTPGKILFNSLIQQSLT